MDKPCNKEDEMIWTDKNEESKKTLDACGGIGKCMGEAKCVKECMESKLGLSKRCATCFGEFTQCGKSNCSMSCICKLSGNDCDACIECVKNKCENSFISCSGLDSPFNWFGDDFSLNHL